MSSATEPPDLPLTAGIIVAALAWPLSVALLYGLLAVAEWLWIRSRRAGQVVLSAAEATGLRAPVLFLRSFGDDQVSLKAARVPLYLRALDPGASAHQLEELVVTRLAAGGPAVAIGRPDDLRPPVGAIRAYLPDGAWQPTVAALMDAARVIIVSLSFSDGLAWELDQIRVRGHVGKALFVVPPDLTARPATVSERISLAGLPVPLTPIGAGAGPHVVASWATRGGAPTVVLTRRPTELTYDLALQLFLADHPEASAAPDQVGRGVGALGDERAGRAGVDPGGA